MVRTRERRGRKASSTSRGIAKTPTGIGGFDEITAGGLPRGRASLVCGGAGSGKTLFGMHFLVKGALEYREPGVFIAFEEREEELAQNVASLGFDLDSLVRRKLLLLDHIYVERSEIEESGEYDLEGLFLRLELAIDSIGAKRVVIDTLETIFGGLTNQGIIRSELRRLFRWLNDRGITAVITAERGEGTLTRHGLEEYVSDCVIALDHRVTEQVSTRRLRVVKYRGTTHGTNEYPFLIDEGGFKVVPITSFTLDYPVSFEHVSSGIAQLDPMLGGAGYFRGSTVLVSGAAGTGKTSVCGHFAAASCERGERCLLVSYEESPQQMTRNMASIGLDLASGTKKSLLRMLAMRATTHGLEAHLALLHRAVTEFAPSAVVIDPIGTLARAGTSGDAHVMVVRLIDFLKSRGITTVMTNLTASADELEQTDLAISSLVDTWLLIKYQELNGERNRSMHVLKSRGMNHSNQVREFVLTGRGIQLLEPYIGEAGVLTGAARLIQESRDHSERVELEAEQLRYERLLEHKRALLDERISALRAEFCSEEAELSQRIRTAKERTSAASAIRSQLAGRRGANGESPGAAAKSNSSRRVSGRHSARAS